MEDLLNIIKGIPNLQSVLNSTTNVVDLGNSLNITNLQDQITSITENLDTNGIIEILESLLKLIPQILFGSPALKITQTIKTITVDVIPSLTNGIEKTMKLTSELNEPSSVSSENSKTTTDAPIVTDKNESTISEIIETPSINLLTNVPSDNPIISNNLTPDTTQPAIIDNGLNGNLNEESTVEPNTPSSTLQSTTESTITTSLQSSEANEILKQKIESVTDKLKFIKEKATELVQYLLDLNEVLLSFE